MIRPNFQAAVCAVLQHGCYHHTTPHTLTIVDPADALRKAVTADFCNDPLVAGTYFDHVEAGGVDTLYALRVCPHPSLGPDGFIWVWQHKHGYVCKVVSSY